MKEITDLVRPEIYAMQPYSSARLEGRQDVSIFLDANENPYQPYPGGEAQQGLNRYPQPQPGELLAAFSRMFEQPVANLFVSRGADEAIDLLVRALCTAGRDAIVVTPPTFVMYETAAQIQGASVREVPLRLEGDTFTLDVPGILGACRENPGTKLVFICSPNNPTSNLMQREDIAQLARDLFGTALVVVDELYLDYSRQPSMAAELAEHPNLVVLRSMSKELSLAGERIGITIAHPDVIGVLRRIMAPYPLTASAIRSALAVASPEGLAHARANIETILGERDALHEALAAHPAVSQVFPSDANFVLFRVADAPGLTAFMANHGIKVRDRSSAIPGAIRLSIGTPEENREFMRALSGYEQRYGSK